MYLDNDVTPFSCCLSYDLSAATCTVVEVAGAEDDISGTYTFDGSSYYVRRGGSTSYILGKYIDDQWLLGEGLNIYSADDSYPYYYVSVSIDYSTESIYIVFGSVADCSVHPINDEIYHSICPTDV